MTRINIPTFSLFVIPLLLLAASAAAALGVEPFIGAGSHVQASSSPDGPTLPQLRVSGETGLRFSFPSNLGFSVSLGGMSVRPSIPADSVLYRGYAGLYLSAAVDFRRRRGAGAEPSVSLGGSAALAHYADTDLYFIAYALQAAPGLSFARERVDMMLSFPLRAEFRGDGHSLSCGIALAAALVGTGRAEKKR